MYSSKITNYKYHYSGIQLNSGLIIDTLLILICSVIFSVGMIMIFAKTAVRVRNQIDFLDLSELIAQGVSARPGLERCSLYLKLYEEMA